MTLANGGEQMRDYSKGGKPRADVDVDGEMTGRYNVTLTPATRDGARAIGNGNVSAGLREAVRYYVQQHGDTAEGSSSKGT